MQSVTYTIRMVQATFDLPSMEDAWNLVMHKGWDCNRHPETANWLVTIPTSELPEKVS